MTNLSSWMPPPPSQHGCPPYSTRVLIPYCHSASAIWMPTSSSLGLHNAWQAGPSLWMPYSPWFGHPVHDCHLLPCCRPPPPAQDLIPYIRQPLLGSPLTPLRCSDTSSVHLFTWKLFSNCFGSDNPYQPAAPCGLLLLPGWALTSNAGQLPCVYALVILLGFWHHILDCPLQYGHFSYAWTHSLCVGCPSMWTLLWTTVVTSHQLWMCTLALGLNCWLGRGGEKGEV